MIDRVARSASRNPLLRYLAVGAVCAVAGGVAGGLSAMVGGDGAVQIAIRGLAMAAAMAVGMLACRRWWNSIDEAAREAHKWAWWWGSTYGLAIAGVGLLTLMTTRGGEALILADRSPADVLITGAGAVVLVQTVGYGIAWAVWWLRRR